MEGSSMVDKKFKENYEGACKTRLRVGAYHFFSFDSEGRTQAENFIKTVPVDDEMLPPVVDFEFYGNKEKHLPNKEKVKKELDVLLQKLEEQYGRKPILYVTKKPYQLYIEGDFEEYDTWVRDVIGKPSWMGERKWLFWQYSNRGRLDGYKGTERFIDLNVFGGTKEEWNAYGRDENDE